MPLRRRAHAKINLALGVGPPEHRLHPIASWMHAIDLADDVAVDPLPARRESTFHAAWAPDAPRPARLDWNAETDLAARAHRLLCDHTGHPLPAAIRLTKRIPAGAGLGGGSSDAAATLMALDDAFDLGLGPSALAELSASLGSDVAFFIEERVPPRPALVTGLGDRIERLAPLDAPILLILPPCACPTGAVYAAYDRLGPRPLDEARVASLARGSNLHDLFNDLAPAAEHLRPEIATVRHAASEALARPVHVTGSGSALFALADASGAPAVESALDGTGAVVLPTRLLGPSE